VPYVELERTRYELGCGRAGSDLTVRYPAMEDVRIEWQHTEARVVSHSNGRRTTERAEQKLGLQYLKIPGRR
jgi:hypothetical protein